MVDQTRNPRDKENALFKRLTRLFSGPITNRKTQLYRQEKRRRLDKYRFKSASGKSFKKSSYSPFEQIQANAMANQNRSERYVDFDQMEYTPEIASALDIYADEMTTSTSLEPMLQIDCPNEEIKAVLKNLYINILNVEFNLFGWARTMCKYGDFFLYLDVDENDGITNVIGLPAQEVERLEGEDTSNPNYVQFQWNSGGMTFENWQIGHFRILGNDKYAPYGTSILEPARRIWRQLCIAKGELVLTPDGPVPVEKIKAGDYVFCYDYESKEIRQTKVVSQKHMGKQDVYELKTNHRSLKVTDRHGMLVFDGKEKKYVYKQAQKINISDDRIPLTVVKGGEEEVSFVLDSERSVSLSVPFEYEKEGIMENIRKGNFDYSDKNVHSFLLGKKRVPYYEWLNISEHFNIPKEQAEFWFTNSKKRSLTDSAGIFKGRKDFARLFGFLLGDGWIGKNRVGFADGVDEEKNSFYRNFLEDLSCSTAHITPPLKGMSGGQTNVFSKEFKEILEAAGFETGAFNKVVPQWIYSMSLESRREFVSGYFDADGSQNDGRVTSISYRLLEGIRELAMMSGIPCGRIIQDRKEGLCKDDSYRKNSYRLYLNMDKESWVDDTVLEKVLSFELSKEDEDTFDIQVEDSVHNFIVNGMVSHNTLLEDAMMAYRIVRSPERRVFYIDIGNIEPNDVEQYMQKIITTMKRNQVIDDQTGRVDLRYNPLSIEEDYFLPTHGPNTSTKVESLPGGTYTGDIDDVKYLRDKLFSALKVPQSYLSRGEESDEDKATLAQKDIRFARTIQRLQRSLLSELEKIGVIHLYTLGFRGDDLIAHTLTLNNPSKIAELQELEHWRTKFDVASAATDGFFSKRWVAQNIFGLTDEEFLRNQREMFYDRKFEAALDLESEGLDAEGAGGGLDLGGEDLGGEDLGGEGDLDLGDEGGTDGDIDLGGDEELGAEGGEDETLLAAPGKREDKMTTTPRSKGKMYMPKKYRGGDRRKAGARRRSNLAKGANEKGRATRRNVFGGASEMFSIADGIFESYEASYREETELIKENQKDAINRYKEEESKLLKRDENIKNLMSDLERALSSDGFSKASRLTESQNEESEAQ